MRQSRLASYVTSIHQGTILFAVHTVGSIACVERSVDNVLVLVFAFLSGR